MGTRAQGPPRKGEGGGEGSQRRGGGRLLQRAHPELSADQIMAFVEAHSASAGAQ